MNASKNKWTISKGRLIMFRKDKSEHPLTKEIPSPDNFNSEKEWRIVTNYVIKKWFKKQKEVKYG